MVALNPGEQYGVAPTPDPEYTSYRWSRTIPEPGANKAGEILTKGLGSALAEGAAGFNRAYETAAQGAAQTAKEAAEAAQISDLQSTLSMIKGETPVVSNAAASSYASVEPEGPEKLNILSTDKKEILPEQVKDSARIAQNLESARANGTFSNSYYDMQKSTYLKNVRTQYPGYRGIVDRTFGDPANATINSLLGDLNSYARAANDHAKEGLAMLRGEVKEGTPGADVVLSQAEQGKLSPAQINTYVNQANQDKWTARQTENTWKTADSKDKLLGLKAEKAAQVSADTVVSGIMNTISITTNTGEALGISKALEDTSSGRFDSKHSLEAGQQLLSAKASMVSLMDKKLHEVDKDSGRSMAMDMGEAKVQALIKERMKPMDEYVDRFMNHEHGAANLIKFQNEAIVNEGKNKWLTNPTIGAQIEKGTALRELLGPASEPFLMQQFNAGTNLSKDAQHFFLDKATNMATQLNYPKELSTFNDTLAQVQKDNTLSKEGSQLAKKIIGFSDHIADPKLSPEVRANYALAAFAHPDLLDKFAPASTDGRGRRVPGQMDVYQRFGTAKFSQSVRQLSEQGHPEVWDTYEKFMEGSFGDPNRGLFSTHVRSMNGAITDPTVVPHYDNETGHFGVSKGPMPSYGPTSKTTKQTPSGYLGSAYQKSDLYFAKQMVTELNKGIDTIKNVHDQTGIHDINAYLFQLFGAMGDQPTKGSFMSKMVQSVIIANQKPEGVGHK